MKIILSSLLVALLLASSAAFAKAKPRSGKGRPQYCSADGRNCLSYEQIEALRRSLRDQDRSSRGRGFPFAN